MSVERINQPTPTSADVKRFTKEKHMKKFIFKNGVTSQSLSGNNLNSEQASRPVVGRRSFLKGLGATGALSLSASALLISKAQAQEMTKKKDGDSGGKLTKAMPQFLASSLRLKSSRAIYGSNTGNSEGSRRTILRLPIPRPALRHL
jgi:hypothetical protein